MPKPSATTIKLSVQEIDSLIASLQSRSKHLGDALQEIEQAQQALRGDLPKEAGGTSTTATDWASVSDSAAETLEQRAADLQRRLESLVCAPQPASNKQISGLVLYTLLVLALVVAGIFVAARQGNTLPPDLFEVPSDARLAPAKPEGGAGNSGGAVGNAAHRGAVNGASADANTAGERDGAVAGTAAGKGEIAPPQLPTEPPSDAPEDAPEIEAAPSVPDAEASAGDNEQPAATGAAQTTVQGSAANDPPETPPEGQGKRQVSTAWILAMFPLLGALGGILRLIGSLSIYIAENKLYRNWLPYYYLMPLDSALLATVVCLLVLAGILNTGISAGSLLALYALAAFTGLFAKNAMRKLKDLADTLFAKPSTQDAAE